MGDYFSCRLPCFFLHALVVVGEHISNAFEKKVITGRCKKEKMLTGIQDFTFYKIR